MSVVKKAAAKKRKRERLSKEEESEMKRTCGNVFSWLKPSPLVRVFQEHIHMVEEEPEDMVVLDRDREERLDRVKKKQLEYKVTFIC